MEVGVSFVGCHDCLQEKAVQRGIIELISSVCQGRRIQPEAHRRFELGKCGTKIHSHVSLPCTGGSPILNFRQQSREKHVEVFEELANSVDCLLKKVEEVYGQVSKSRSRTTSQQSVLEVGSLEEGFVEPASRV